MFCFSAFEAKLAAVETAHQDNQAKLNQDIQQLREENATLKDESRKVAREMGNLESQLQQC